VRKRRYRRLICAGLLAALLLCGCDPAKDIQEAAGEIFGKFDAEESGQPGDIGAGESGQPGDVGAGESGQPGDIDAGESGQTEEIPASVPRTGTYTLHLTARRSASMTKFIRRYRSRRSPCV